MSLVATGTDSLTITVDSEGCHHEADIRLGCPWHDYEHTWGYACGKGWDPGCREQFMLATEPCRPSPEDVKRLRFRNKRPS